MKLRGKDKSFLNKIGCPEERQSSYEDSLNWLTEQNYVSFNRYKLPVRSYHMEIIITTTDEKYETNIGNLEMQIRYLYTFVLPAIINTLNKD